VDLVVGVLEILLLSWISTVSLILVAVVVVLIAHLVRELLVEPEDLV
jgi:cell division protein FtsL